ncbi:MAG: glycosyltransferase family A protein [Nevskia sp.]|nr:glycosyltransferase family A protein [Nevskia sp.]
MSNPIPFVLIDQQRPPASHPPGTPKISCLMVTRGRLSRARLAIDCYLRQTYPDKELVIVSESPQPALREHLAALGREDLRLVTLSPAGRTLGALRNIAVEQAQGELVCQWDDDDLCDPQRLEVQYGILRHAQSHACLMQRWLLWWPARRRLAVTHARRWEGSILCLRSAMPRYPDLVRAEDTPAIQQLCASARVALFSLPQLYVYVVHGDNTCSDTHFESFWNDATVRVADHEYDFALERLALRLPVKEYLQL